jgi:hypothetical protein
LAGSLRVFGKALRVAVTISLLRGASSLDEVAAVK